jgi:type III pantothenate kinase
MTRRLKREWPTRDVPRVVATGGLAPLIAKYSTEIEEVHPDLTLQGLRLAYEYLAGSSGA